MPKVTVIRHAEAEYPHDRLTEGGKEAASFGRERFGGYSRVVCSPKKRSAQTAEALGYGNYSVDERVDEFEAELNAPTPEEYVLLLHSEMWSQLTDFGNRILDAIREHGTEDDTLIVAHNAVMSAAIRILTGEIAPFPNLGGFEVDVTDGEIGQPRRL